MRDYYREVSYNKLDVTGVVSGHDGPTGWYRAQHPKGHYTGGNYGFGELPHNAQSLVEEVIDLAIPHVNFADFDGDGDGFVDSLVVIAAGSGAENTGKPDDFWSHKWELPTPKTVDRVKIRSYFMGAEDGKVGVMCHELGHLLFKWPDLYDTDYTSKGTGNWDLMGGGNWNEGGETPAHPVAWCKVKAGWVNPVTILNEEQNVTIKPFATNDDVYKLPIRHPHSREYFLLSNRQRVSYDNGLPGDGLIIEHVDEEQTNNTDESHYLVDIEQADGSRQLNLNVNPGDVNDPFPTPSSSEFTSSTNPNSRAYDGSHSNVSVTNIQRSTVGVTAHISVGGTAARRWHEDKKVIQTYAHHTEQEVWADVESLGWRRIKGGSSDGTTNIFIMCCDAVVKEKNVRIDADGQFIYTASLV